MTSIVVYASRYGSTEVYARAFAEKYDLEVIPFKQLPSLEDYDTVFHFGALFASGTYGLKETVKKLDPNRSQRLIIVTVGLSDPEVEKNTDDIRKHIEELLPPAVLEQTKIYHLRGRINYEELTPLHRFMMKMVYLKAQRTPPEEQTAEIKDMKASYGQAVDFVDLDSLDKIKY